MLSYLEYSELYSDALQMRLKQIPRAGARSAEYESFTAQVGEIDNGFLRQWVVVCDGRDEITGVQENGVKALRVKASVHDGEVYRPGLKYIVQRGAALGDDGHPYVAVSCGIARQHLRHSAALRARRNSDDKTADAAVGRGNFLPHSGARRVNSLRKRYYHLADARQQQALATADKERSVKVALKRVYRLCNGGGRKLHLCGCGGKASKAVHGHKTAIALVIIYLGFYTASSQPDMRQLLYNGDSLRADYLLVLGHEAHQVIDLNALHGFQRQVITHKAVRIAAYLAAYYHGLPAVYLSLKLGGKFLAV